MTQVAQLALNRYYFVCQLVAQTTCANKSVLSASGTGGTTSAKYTINSIIYLALVDLLH